MNEAGVDEQDMVMEMEEEQEITEAQPAKGLRSPYIPTKAEIDEHELTHLPPRSWCKHCVACRSYEDQHRTRELSEGEKESAITTVSMDYYYLNENWEDRKTRKEKEAQGIYAEDEDPEVKRRRGKPIIAVYDGTLKGGMTHRVAQKGKGNGWIIRKIKKDIDDLGYSGGRIALKCDQEPAIVEVQEAVMASRESQTIPRNSPVGSSASNGAVENYIKQLEAQIRTIRDDLEAHIKHKVEVDSDVFDWLVAWAGVLLFMYAENSKTGRTAYQNLTG